MANLKTLDASLLLWLAIYPQGKTENFSESQSIRIGITDKGASDKSEETPTVFVPRLVYHRSRHLLH